MKKIYVCSPLSGDLISNQNNARDYCKHIVNEYGFLPIAPHIYFTQFMNDNNSEERERALVFNKDLISFCDELWICSDVVSEGMQYEIDYAYSLNKPIYNILEGCYNVKEEYV